MKIILKNYKVFLCDTDNFVLVGQLMKSVNYNTLQFK